MRKIDTLYRPYIDPDGWLRRPQADDADDGLAAGAGAAEDNLDRDPVSDEPYIGLKMADGLALWEYLIRLDALGQQYRGRIEAMNKLLGEK